MTLKQALKYFDGNQAALARAARRTRCAVNHWKTTGGKIPMLAQLEIEASTGGLLKADPIRGS